MPKVYWEIPPTETTAYHEAGHAVVAVMTGIRFQAVVAAYIDYPNGATAGHLRRPDFETVHAAIDEDTGGSMPGGNRGIWHQREIQVCYAGIKAEARLTGKEDWDAATGDMKTAQRMAVCITSSEAEAQALLHWAEMRASALVSDPIAWAAIEQVAAQLLADRIVLECEVKAAYYQAREQAETNIRRET